MHATMYIDFYFFPEFLSNHKMGTSNHRMRKHKYDEKVTDKKKQKTTNISMNDVTNEYWKVNKGV